MKHRINTKTGELTYIPESDLERYSLKMRYDEAVANKQRITKELLKYGGNNESKKN